jgi:phosphoenolpyruvate synthase/pyruvate phosphate dikinase
MLRTEKLLFHPDRKNYMCAIALAESEEERRAALQKLLPLHEHDLHEIFRAASGRQVREGVLYCILHSITLHCTAVAVIIVLIDMHRVLHLTHCKQLVLFFLTPYGLVKVTVRLMDPPLHEFLPDPKSAAFAEDIASLANHLGQHFTSHSTYAPTHLLILLN